MLISNAAKIRTVDIVIYPGFKSFEAIGPMTVFAYANKNLEAQGRSVGYQVRIVSTKIGAVRSDTLMCLDATHVLEKEVLAHSILLVGAHEIERVIVEQSEIVEWARHVALRVDRFAALCSGAFFLAAAGLLDGKRATTHWRMASAMQRGYPNIQVDIDSIFIREGNLWTSAGVSASVDLALSFVESDFGHDLALQVAQDLVIFLKRPGGQSQFSANLTSQVTQAPGMRAIQEWVLNNIDQKISVSLMADKASMSIRNFTRSFHRDVGVCPSEFLEMARIDKARRMLSESKLPMKSVALKCGFSNAAQMRNVFKKHLSITPKQYQERFLGS